MRRNSNIIGPLQPISKNNGNGIHDTFDNYNARVLDRWPLVLKYLSITVNGSTAPLTLNEGSSLTVVVNIEGLAADTTYYYTILSVGGTVTTADFIDATVNGSFTVSSSTNTGTFTKALVFDGTSEAGDAFQIQIRTGSTSGPIVLTSSTITIANPSFSITPSSSSFNEGSSVTWNVATTNVTNGRILYYSYAGTPANSTDITSSLSGSFSIGSNIGSFATTAGNDFTTEGAETLTAYVRVGSTAGTVVATGTVTINDTSITPGATITPSSNSVDEGSSVTFTVNTTNFPSGTLSWNTVLSAEMEGEDISATTGTVSISGSTGSIVITATSDGFTETGQTESFQVRVLSPAAGNPVLATSSAVTINDTSTGTPEPVGYTRVAVNKSPTLGTAGHPTYPPVGWTGRQNATADDANLSVSPIPTFTINNVNYTTVYVGSNNYLTFGSGASIYSNLSGSNPALNKIHVGAADNSYQRVSTISSGANYTRIRYEGNAATSGTPGSPGIVWEATFFDMSKTGNVPVVEILVGNHNRTTGQFGIASTSAYYQTSTLLTNTSYVFVGNSTGTSWTIYPQQSMSNTGY